MCKIIHKVRNLLNTIFKKKKKTFLGLIALKNHTNETVINFLFFVTFIHIFNYYLMTAILKILWCSLSVKVMLLRAQEGGIFLRNTHSMVLTQVRGK